ncbi:hypothetical protein [Citrobacter sp. FDAARGOS_156]|uniref:hypothetical protein n=1 Tax=Citrobacter sp. FDAARGOS_156 TaxID=1702170 RepID=UPI001F3752D1|nr:hypothetical protein [Citrobacter sp. FDAARGOS_156]
MTATNKPMTGAQLDELMAVAMRMQSDSEKMGERPVSMFAYAVQVAVLEIRETRCMYEELQSQNADLAVQLANAESKCRELAAELSAVDKIHNEAVFITDDHYEQCPSEVQKMIRSLAVLQIPAYNAFLAEVRAQARNELINELESRFNEMTETLPPELRSGAAGAAVFVSTFRKGAAL